MLGDCWINDDDDDDDGPLKELFSKFWFINATGGAFMTWFEEDTNGVGCERSNCVGGSCNGANWILLVVLFSVDGVADCLALTPINAILNDKYEPTITSQSIGIY